MKTYKIFLFPVIAAALIFSAGCSESEKVPEVKIKKDVQELTGKIRCPKCRKTLQKSEMIAKKQPLFQCALCSKISPEIKFYPDVKIKRKKIKKQ